MRLSLEHELAWLLRYGYVEWHCWRCKFVSHTLSGGYFHLNQVHDLAWPGASVARDDELVEPLSDAKPSAT